MKKTFQNITCIMSGKQQDLFLIQWESLFLDLVRHRRLQRNTRKISRTICRINTNFKPKPGRFQFIFTWVSKRMKIFLENKLPVTLWTDSSDFTSFLFDLQKLIFDSAFPPMTHVFGQQMIPSCSSLPSQQSAAILNEHWNSKLKAEAAFYILHQEK